MAGKEFTGKDKVVTKMTRDGLTEENLADGSVKDISHKSRGRPMEMKQDFVFDREKKKTELSDGQTELDGMYLILTEKERYCMNFYMYSEDDENAQNVGIYKIEIALESEVAEDNFIWDNPPNGIFVGGQN